jgi:hypothetical protein
VRRTNRRPALWRECVNAISPKSGRWSPLKWRCLEKNRIEVFKKAELDKTLAFGARFDSEIRHTRAATTARQEKSGRHDATTSVGEAGMKSLNGSSRKDTECLPS